MKIQNKESILFIGDSITDCDRVRPVGVGAGLGESCVYPNTNTNTNTNVYEVMASDGNTPYKEYT